MMNHFGFQDDNCCLYILIILLLLCACKNGCISGIIDKICNSGCLLPVLIALLCCSGKCCGGKSFLGGCGCNNGCK